MKALVYYGPRDLRITDIDNVSPKKGEVLIRIKACGICGSDVHGYLGTTGRRIPPMVMGHEFAGEIAELGPETTLGYHKGDRVTVQPVNSCGVCDHCKKGYTNTCVHKKFYGVMDVNGAFAEYLCVPETLLYSLPDNISFSEGALIEPMAVAYCAVKKAGDLINKNVLIVGAGTIGQLLLMVVKTMRPKNIIISDISDFRLEGARQLGATSVVNPKNSDFVEEINKILNGGLVDVAFEAVGISSTVSQALSALKPRGTCIWVGNNARTVELNMQDVVTKEYKIFGTYIYTHKEFGDTIQFMSENNLDLAKLITKEISVDQAPKMFEELISATDKYLKVVVRF